MTNQIKDRVLDYIALGCVAVAGVLHGLASVIWDRKNGKKARLPRSDTAPVSRSNMPKADIGNAAIGKCRVEKFCINDSEL